MRNATSSFALHGKPGLSPLGIMEIEAGFEDELRSAKRKAFLDQILPMSEMIPYGIEESCLGGEIYARLEAKRQRIGVVDTAIAATAITRGLMVVSANKRHFQRIVDIGYPLEIKNWREP